MARRTYSLDFKVSAAKLVTEQGYGPKRAATSLGVAPSTMQYWVRRFGATPARTGPPPADPAALKAENDRLREENRRLLMEPALSGTLLRPITENAGKSGGAAH